MNSTKPNADKRDIRSESHLTTPPRLEGKAKNARMNPTRKQKAPASSQHVAKKSQGYSEGERKRYQLRSKRH